MNLLDPVPPMSHRVVFTFIIFAVLVLLAASWAWARWALIRPAPEFEFDEGSFSVNLLIAGAVPWFVQWAGIACLLVGFLSSRWGLDRRAVLKAAGVPLIVGAAWWTGIVAVHWSENPLDWSVAASDGHSGSDAGVGSLVTECFAVERQ
ncbi:MAG: hypothetical protein GXX96_16230 [Planctomycetaceae bacterium]|nr:hypothetical protein [Planctomycetaceae bacterium]